MFLEHSVLTVLITSDNGPSPATVNLEISVMGRSGWVGKEGEWDWGSSVLSHPEFYSI